MQRFNRVALSGVMLFAIVTAHAGVVAVVSAKSSVKTLTADQVSDIFLGKIGTFPNGSQAVPIDQASGAAIRDEFYTKVTGRTSAQLKSYWAKQSFSGKGTPPKAVTGDDEVKKLISANPNTIGYMESGKVDSSVRVVQGQ